MAFPKPTRMYGEASAIPPAEMSQSWPEPDIEKGTVIPPIEIKPKSATEELPDTLQDTGR